MARSRAELAIEKEFDRVNTQIQERMVRLNMTEKELLQHDPFLCGQAYVLSRLMTELM